jgi:hypothetical protein
MVQKKIYFRMRWGFSSKFHQILPIVPGGSKQEIIDACILASPYLPQFKKRYLYENMRVNGLLNSLTADSTEEEMKHVLFLILL